MPLLTCFLIYVDLGFKKESFVVAYIHVLLYAVK